MDPEDLPGWAATPASYSAPSTPIPGEDMEGGEAAAAAVLVNNKNVKFELGLSLSLKRQTIIFGSNKKNVVN